MSPAATVETINLGTPTGRARMAWAASAVPPDPPRATAPSSFPASHSRASVLAAPAAIVVTAAPRSPAAHSSGSDTPAAAATASASMSTPATSVPWTPQSTSNVPTPVSLTRSRRNRYSAPLVSNVPSSTTVGIDTPR